MNRHIAFVGRDGAGHVNPTLPVVAELARRGHRVTYACAASFADAVQRAGAHHVELPATDFRSGGDSGQNALRNPDTDIPAMIAELLIAHTEHELPVLRDAFAADPPDAVCYDTNSLAGAMLAALRTVPAVQLRPTFAANTHYTPLQEFVPDPQRLRTALAAADARVRDYTTAYGVTHTLGTVLSSATGDLTVVFVPREFQYHGDTFGERHLFVGPSAHDRVEAGSWQPPTGSRLLFISLGTLMNQNPEFFRRCLDAFTGTDWHVAMAIGERVQPTELGDLPPNVEIRPYFPQLDVLEHADAFITHAGMNSTMEAILHQVPTVAVPQMPEQRANARRLTELGLGITLTEQSAEALRQAVDDVAHDERISKNLAETAAQFRTAGGAPAAADAIEQLVN